MNYIDLDTIKKHLNIAMSFTDDDEYLLMLADASTEVIVNDLRVESIDSLLVVDSDGNKSLPSSLKCAVLLMIGNFYANRESVAAVNMSSLPKSLDYLLDLHRSYKNGY